MYSTFIASISLKHGKLASQNTKNRMSYGKTFLQWDKLQKCSIKLWETAILDSHLLKTVTTCRVFTWQQLFFKCISFPAVSVY